MLNFYYMVFVLFIFYLLKQCCQGFYHIAYYRGLSCIGLDRSQKMNPNLFTQESISNVSIQFSLDSINSNSDPSPTIKNFKDLLNPCRCHSDLTLYENLNSNQKAYYNQDQLLAFIFGTSAWKEASFGKTRFFSSSFSGCGFNSIFFMCVCLGKNQL